MFHTLKWVGYSLLAILGVGLAIGIGAALSALGAILGMLVLGGGAILTIILLVRELLGDEN